MPAAASAGTGYQPNHHNGGHQDGTGVWRTRADDGWAAARAAAEPPVAGRTRSGLPKRAPQAQLVPGGVASEPVARSPAYAR